MNIHNLEELFAFYININIETTALIAGNVFYTLTIELSVAYGNILYKVLNGFLWNVYQQIQVNSHFDIIRPKTYNEVCFI